MSHLYAKWMEEWENRLCNRATDRVVRPFEWGEEWARAWPTGRSVQKNGDSPESYFRKLNRAAIRDSDAFFGYTGPRDFHLDDGLLTFTSPVETPWPENNKVHAQWFPAVSRNGVPSRKAVVVLPHWNAPQQAHNALARGIAKLGISALRISLPYHDFRMPPELHRADYAVSSNIGRTLDAARQAVIDVRSCYDWLEQQGCDRLGIVGTSLGSCYAYLVSAHDPRISVNVFNHCSTYFGDVVWTGLSTRHVREGLEGRLDREGLREAWLAISPVSYIEKWAAGRHKSVFLYTTYDTTFLPELSRDVVSRIGQHDVDHKVVALPCGHYTMGEFPFKFIAGYHICSFLKRNL